VNDRVFISYSKHDTEVANAICAAIENQGRPCWIAPRDIQPSGEWAEQIIDGINATNVMVMVFSSSSNRSPQVRREVERAINREMPVIPFRIEQVLPVKSLEYFLSTQHWFDAFDGPLDAHIARLCRLVESIVRRAPGDASASTTDVTGNTYRPTATHLTASFAMPPRIPAMPTYRDEDLSFVTRELAREIGPIARYLVQRASSSSPTAAAMIETLAAEFKEPKERALFTSTCKQRLGL
jgi:hypothetical protein